MTKWEMTYTTTPHFMSRYLADGWQPYAVLKMADGDIQHYFRRQVNCQEHIDIEAIRNTEAYNAIRANTLKEVGAWLRARWPAPDNPINVAWALVFHDQLAALERGEMPK